MNDIILQIIHLRLAVAFLGQNAPAPWWNCQFLSPATLEALEDNFHHSALLAGFTATCLAAKLHHDSLIGRTRVIHLFRLNPDLEILVQRTAIENSTTALQSFALDWDSCIAKLAYLAGEEIDSPEGPVQIGTLNHASTARGVAELARHYHASFRLGFPIYPYFAALSK